ncbi:hypothetical protein V6C03_02145 [Methyloligella sp. 2.7D]|uniref:hypothetical protein n=1 Tax=unclassified Methyloligella TaxID=2625955 RepID=UPI00157C57B3|nr:hypothetical protein [Methyloligella sp. GL2]QKP76563.1 hypothetical protein HT051_03275 [Methyloligella sp. GL2]
MPTTLNNIYVTLYGHADNDPPGTDTTSLGGHAGGTGTYDDPVTAAANSAGLSGQFAYGTKFYVPELQKYFVIGDLMANNSGGDAHVDLWVQSNAGTPQSVSNAAENALTGNYQLILNPSPDEPVNHTRLINAASDIGSVVGDNASVDPSPVASIGDPGSDNPTPVADDPGGNDSGFGGGGNGGFGHWRGNRGTDNPAPVATDDPGGDDSGAGAGGNGGFGHWRGGGGHWGVQEGALSGGCSSRYPQNQTNADQSAVDDGGSADLWSFHHWNHHG